jgi:hypothetical protein
VCNSSAIEDYRFIQLKDVKKVMKNYDLLHDVFMNTTCEGIPEWNSIDGNGFDRTKDECFSL